MSNPPDNLFKDLSATLLSLDWNRDLAVLTADIAGILTHQVARYNWVGFYWVIGDELILGAWDGPAATQHTRIPLQQGVCGFSARSGETVVVPDVSQDPRYLQCFINTRSEIVVPIERDGEVFGLIDIDSDRIDPFTDGDVRFLKWLADKIAQRHGRQNA